MIVSSRINSEWPWFGLRTKGRYAKNAGPFRAPAFEGWLARAGATLTDID